MDNTFIQTINDTLAQVQLEKREQLKHSVDFNMVGPENYQRLSHASFERFFYNPDTHTKTLVSLDVKPVEYIDVNYDVYEVKLSREIMSHNPGERQGENLLDNSLTSSWFNARLDEAIEKMTQFLLDPIESISIEK